MKTPFGKERDMTNEKIIATIEKYVESLNDEDRKAYNMAFDISRKDIVPIKDFFDKVGIPVFGLAMIVQELEQEMKKAAQKKVGGSSYVKRTALINKLIAKNTREELRKGWFEEIEGERMQCFLVNGYMAFAFRNTVDAPMNETDNPFTLMKVLKCRKEDLTECEYDIADIKMQLKLHKARKEKGICEIKVGTKYYDAQYFVNVIEGLGGDVIMLQDSDSWNRMDIFKSENGLAILMPIRPTKGETV